MDLKKIVKKRKPAEYLLWAGITVLGVLLDQLTKWLAVEFLMERGSVPLIKGVLHLTYVENTGAAFGMLKGMPWVFNTVSVVAIVAMLAYLFLGHGNGRVQCIALAMIASGGIGNMIDRTVLGYVIDFIDFCLIDFAVFNGADSFVCVGAGLLILSLILEIVDEAKKNKAAKECGSADVSAAEVAGNDNNSLHTEEGENDTDKESEGGE